MLSSTFVFLSTAPLFSKDSWEIDWFIAWMRFPHSGILFTLASHIVQAKWNFGKSQITNFDAKQALLSEWMTVCSHSILYRHTYSTVCVDLETKCHGLVLPRIVSYWLGQYDRGHFSDQLCFRVSLISSWCSGCRQEGEAREIREYSLKWDLSPTCNNTGLFFK